MAETSEQLREEAVKHFNECLDLIRSGKLEKALESLQKAEEAACEAHTDVILLHTLKLRGQILESLGRLEEALEIFTFALKTNEKFLEKDPENELFLDILEIDLNNIGNLGNKFRETGNFQFSKRSYEIGLGICQKRLELQPENDFCRTYAGNTLNNVGELLAEKGETEEAKENYERALEVYEKLLKDYPGDFEHISDKVMTLQNLGILFSEKGQKKEARENLKKALEIMESLSKSYPENTKIKEEINLTQEKIKVL